MEGLEAGTPELAAHSLHPARYSQPPKPAEGEPKHHATHLFYPYLHPEVTNNPSLMSDTYSVPSKTDRWSLKTYPMGVRRGGWVRARGAPTDWIFHPLHTRLCCCGFVAGAAPDPPTATTPATPRKPNPSSSTSTPRWSSSSRAGASPNQTKHTRLATLNLIRPEEHRSWQAGLLIASFSRATLHFSSRPPLLLWYTLLLQSNCQLLMAFPTKRPTALEGGATHQPLIDPSLPIVGGFGYVAPCKSFVGRPIKMASDYAELSGHTAPQPRRVRSEPLKFWGCDAARRTVRAARAGWLVLCMRCKVGFGRHRLPARHQTSDPPPTNQRQENHHQLNFSSIPPLVHWCPNKTN